MKGGHNIPPNPVQQGAAVQRNLKRQTAGWLAANDPQRKTDRLRAKRKRDRAARQARLNPSLVRERAKALRLV